MIVHLMLPGVILKSGFSHPVFQRYLADWREAAIVAAEDGVSAASVCHQAVLIDLILEGQVSYDWLSVMQDLLTHEGCPIAYSDGYGKRLHKFTEQYLQSTIHSIHTRWWIEKLCKSTELDHNLFAEQVLNKRQFDGLIYDADISKTTLRHRMKSELTMSAAMGAEILFEAGQLTDTLRDELSTSLCDPRKVPPLGYMITEQFRFCALRILDREEQFPAGITEHIEACEKGLEYGWSDFSLDSKIDAYMGTAKRTARDKVIPSPLVACHVAILASTVENQGKQSAILDRLVAYARNLSKNPLNIPAFQMRDVPIPFGSGLTPIEAVCASWLISNLSSR